MRMIGLKVAKLVNIESSKYTDFSTDLQAHTKGNGLYGTGSSTIVETLFKNRFQHLIDR